MERFREASASSETGEQRTWLLHSRAALATARGRAHIVCDPLRNAILRNRISPTARTGASATNINSPVASAELDVRSLPDGDTTTFLCTRARTIAGTSARTEELPGVMRCCSASTNSALVHAVGGEIAALLAGVPGATPLAAGDNDRPTYSQPGIQAHTIDLSLVDDVALTRGAHRVDERLSIAIIEFGLPLITAVLERTP